MFWPLLLSLKSLHCDHLIVDLGSAYFKAALVSPGRFDVLTNQQSKRKTFTGVSFGGETRAFGDEAVRDFTKRPFAVPANFRFLLGLSSEAQLSVEKRLPSVPYPLVFLNNTVAFEDIKPLTSDAATTDGLTVEEVTSHLLDFARTLVRESGRSGEALDLTLTVAAEASTAERQALVRAAAMAGFRRVSLVSETAAAAVQRGVDLAAAVSANETLPEGELGLNLFVNVGAGYTEACVVDYVVANATVAVNVRACEGAIVGGGDFDKVLAEAMENKFFEKFPAIRKEANDPGVLTKARLRLLRQAEATKLLLSANKEALFSIESLLADRDFRVSLKREELENMIAPQISAIIDVITAAITAAGVNVTDIKTREVVGGAWRVPKVLATLTEKFGPFGQRLNGEEAAVLGAAFLAAAGNAGVKLKTKVLLNDNVGKRKYAVNVKGLAESPETIAVSATVFDTYSKLGLRRIVRVPATEVLSSGAALVELLENDKVVDTWTLSTNTTGFVGQLALRFELDTSGLVKLNAAELSAASSAEATNSTAAIPVLSVVRVNEVAEAAVIAAGFASLQAFIRRDAAVTARLAARNSLEGFIYERRAALTEDASIQQVLGPDEGTRLKAALEAAEMWLYSEEGEKATQVILETKLVELKSLGFTAVDRRAAELKAREALGSWLSKAINEVKTALEELQKRPWVSPVVVDKVQKDYAEFEGEWTRLQEAQKTKHVFEEPAFLVGDVKKKVGVIVKEVRRLLKIPKPVEVKVNATANVTAEVPTSEVPTNGTTAGGRQPADEL